MPLLQKRRKSKLKLMSSFSALSAGDFESERFDVLVAGEGLAGLCAAYAAAGEGKSVGIFSSCPHEDSASYAAKGGIAFAIGKNDSAKLHIKDTLETGRGLCSRKVVESVISGSLTRLKELREAGLEFDLGEDGLPDLGLEGGHSRNRVLHIGGDNTGKGLVDFMLRLDREKGVHFFRDSFLAGLITEGKGVKGALFLNNSSGKAVYSDATIMATGGYASLFSESTNPDFSLGSGISAAKNAGAELNDLEFVQFHPTTITDKKANYLVTESVRGEKGMIVDSAGKRIVDELATRDEASRAVYMQGLEGKRVFLDVRSLSSSFIRNRFPSFYTELRETGINPETELVPVTPAAHYTIGGIKTGMHAETNLQGLFAAGEASCSGMHGANRLPCNSLLEAVVLGHEAGLSAAGRKESARVMRGKIAMPAADEGAHENTLSLREATGRIAQLLWEKCGIIRNGKAMEEAVREIGKTALPAEGIKHRDGLRFAQAKALSLLVLESALRREESRGVHYRSDFPAVNIKFSGHTVI
jgi:L-aspartate oxidase